MSLNLPTLALYQACGIHDHMPLDFEQTFHNVNWPSFGTFTVMMKPSNRLLNSRIKHRLFVVCPACGREIPAGRWRQHLRYQHTPTIASSHGVTNVR
jgi:hypothetical protein